MSKPYDSKWPRYFTRGAKGPHVKWLQEVLVAQGAASFVPDGEFGPKTLAALRYFQGTHQGRNGQPLEPDGWFGPEVLWALLNPSGEPQRSHIATTDAIPGGLSGPRFKLLSTVTADYASGEFVEIPDGSNTGPRLKAFSRGVFWCCYYQSDAHKRTTGEYFIGKDHGHCMTLWNAAKKAGCAYPKEHYTPIPGDYAIFSYGGGAGHIVIVSRVDADDFYYNYFGGNEGNRLKHGARKTNQANLLGYVSVFGESEAERAKQAKKFARGVIPAGAGVDTVLGTR